MTIDTIAAVATAPGAGAISIVKVSGPQAIEYTKELFVPRRSGVNFLELPSHRMVLGEITDQGKTIDEVLVSVMRSPGSYTGEDVVEINCHGGYIAARTVLQLLLQIGCRLAEPGEFTRRAFLNGKLSLSQAEAVIDVINARSRQGLQMAVSALSGRAQKQLEQIEDHIILLGANVEASIDFPDEVGDLDIAQTLSLINQAREGIENLIAWAERGRVYREGLKVVISGKPNVGKSSLLNLLLNENRVIVSDLPGTTRDTIEDNIEINGVPVRLIDTAGIRTAHDQIEEMGIARSRTAIEQADLVLMVLDVSAGIGDEDAQILEFIRKQQKPVIFLINKVDLPRRQITDQQLEELKEWGTVIQASVKEDQGITELVDAIFTIGVGVEPGGTNPGFMANLRQKAALQRTLVNLDDLKAAVEANLSLDCLSVDVMNARDNFGEVTGRSIKEAIIDRIFTEFCIGK